MHYCCPARLKQLRGYKHHKTVRPFNGRWFLWQLGKGEYGHWASWTCLCKPACRADLLMISQKAPARQQSVNRRLRMSARLPLVLLWCGGTISQAEMICLNLTKCRLWAGQGWGTMDTLKIAHTLDKFRGPTQVTSIFLLHHSVLSDKCLEEAQQYKLITHERHMTLHHVTAHYRAINTLQYADYIKQQ